MRKKLARNLAVLILIHSFQTGTSQSIPLDPGLAS
jgi:hypothetical protein